jgi:hypothetical protein
MSIGLKLGRALGTAGAYAVEGAVRGAQGAGRFGQEVVTGANDGFAEKRAALLVERAESDARRKLALQHFAAAHQAALAAAGTGYSAPVAETQNAAVMKRVRAAVTKA